MANIFRVALLQASSTGPALETSQAIGIELCRQAAAAGADLAVFPELWSVGFSIADDGLRLSDREEYWRSRAVTVDSGYVDRFRQAAEELSISIAVTILEDRSSEFFNSLILISHQGEIVSLYSKVHVCTFGAEYGISPGSDFPVAILDYRHGEISIGSMICYDREFPESARLLALGGAEVIIVPNACRIDAVRVAQLQSRAFENSVGVAMANYAQRRLDRDWPLQTSQAMNGQSVAFSPIVTDGNGEPVSPLLVQGGMQEAILIADFNMTAIRDYRKRSIWNGTYRRPEIYGALTSEHTSRTENVRSV